MPRSLVRAIEVAVLAAMGVVSVVVIVEVILRYTLGETLVVTEELSRYLMVWIAFLGSVLLMRERGHIAAEGLGSWLGPLGRRLIGLVADLLSLVFLLTLTVAGLQTLLAVSGYCLGCKLYGLHWFLPEVFDRLVLRIPAQPRVGFRSPDAG